SSALSEFDHLRLSGAGEKAARYLLKRDKDSLSGEGYHSELAEKYARILPDIRDEMLQNQLRLRLGEAYRATGQLWEALDCFEIVYKNSSDTDHHHALAGMARAHYDLGQFQSALSYWQQALAKTLDEKDTESEAHVRSGIGWVSYLLGDYDAAIRDFREALRLFRVLGDRRHEGMNMGDMGVVLMALGDMDAAIQLLEQSVDIADLDGSEREAGYKGMYLATAHLLAGEWDAADEVTRITLQYRGAPINKPALLMIHGMILMQLNQADDARHAFQMALQEGETLLNLTPGLYQLRYARGLAYAGLALLNHNPPIDAELELGRAQAICSAAGVLASQARLLNVLKQRDTEGVLAEIVL
ncbi:MAG: tetratricopeptide repeat protein, partial [Aggregatilineales bacterium]